jgi:hypothetical protein
MWMRASGCFRHLGIVESEPEVGRGLVRYADLLAGPFGRPGRRYAAQPRRVRAVTGRDLSASGSGDRCRSAAARPGVGLERRADDARQIRPIYPEREDE